MIFIAESDAEIIILRLFESKSREQGGIQIANFGGNAAEGHWSVAISPKFLPAAGTESNNQPLPASTATKDETQS
jgi:hypothetical protein